MDSQILSDRARAQFYAKLAMSGLVFNPQYVSTVTGQKPTDYVAGTGLEYGAYPVAGGGVQPVKWDANNELWDDVGSPVMREVDLFYTNNPSYTVGSTGDYNTIGEALEDLSIRTAKYLAQGRFITLTMQTGFVIEEQIQAKNIDLSRFILESVDAEVMINRSAITETFGPSFGTFADTPAVFAADNAFLPIINCKMRMGTEGVDTEKNGFNLFNGSRFVVLPEGGLSDGHDNLFSFGSNVIVINDGEFEDGLSHGIRVENGGMVAGRQIEAPGCDTGALIGSGVMADLNSSDLTGATTNGLLCQGGHVSFESGDAQKGASPDATDIVVDGGGVIIANQVNGGGNTIPNAPTENGLIIRDWPDHKASGIFEGSDANGSWTRYPDGTQVFRSKAQLIPATLASGNMFVSDAGERVTFTFSKSFDITEDTPVITAEVEAINQVGTFPQAPTADDVLVGVLSTFNDATGNNVRIVARGHWDTSEVIGKNPPT